MNFFPRILLIHNPFDCRSSDDEMGTSHSRTQGKRIVQRSAVKSKTIKKLRLKKKSKKSSNMFMARTS
jgi:hypothetical protein